MAHYWWASMLVVYSKSWLTPIGSDATVHMAEETRNASAVIPRAMIWSYIINGCLVFIMLITYFFCLTDLDDALATPTGVPFIQVFVQSTGSIQGAAALSSLFVVLIFCSVTNFMTSTSRQVFAFARDAGLPFHKFISRVSYFVRLCFHYMLTL